METAPLTICDTGHNVGGIELITKQLKAINKKLRIVIGMVGDKDVKGSLSLFPKDATYYFTQASVKRAMDVNIIHSIGEELGLKGNKYDNVAEAYRNARKDADNSDFIYIGGSSFVVADYLQFVKNK